MALKVIAGKWTALLSLGRNLTLSVIFAVAQNPPQMSAILLGTMLDLLFARRPGPRLASLQALPGK